MNDPDERIREDSPEARPIIEEMDRIVLACKERHEACCWDIRSVTHASDYATPEERARLHELKMRLRPKSAEEARADILARRAARKQAEGNG